MDFSENLAGTHIFEPQSAHFSKKQFSLHCTVMHCEENGSLSLRYIYHLSNEMKHNAEFTFTVVKSILEFAEDNNLDIIRFKSDNCACKYKCKYLFVLFRNLAMYLNKTIIYYYGVSAHGKGLVDAMGGFGVITSNLFYNSAKDIYNYLVDINDDPAKKYFHLQDISEHEHERPYLQIPDSTSQHIIVYAPDGSIQTNINMCSCKFCILGNLRRCEVEKGTFLKMERVLMKVLGLI